MRFGLQRAPHGLAGVIGVAAMLTALTAHAPARAAEAVLQAFAFEAIPPGASVQVRPADDSEENLTIKQQFEDSLAASNHPASPSGPLIFDFEAVRILQGQRDDPKYLGTFNATQGSAQFTVNLWSNIEHSVLGGTRYSDDFKTANGYTIFVFLRDRATGTLLWQGEATGELRGNSPLPIADDMVRALIANLGQTVRSQSVPVD
jgi:hypothetical protein